MPKDVQLNRRKSGKSVGRSAQNSPTSLSSEKSTNAAGGGAGFLKVVFIIVIWYCTSCLATTGTKVIMKMKILAPEELLLFQMGMTVFYLRIFGSFGILRFNFTNSSLWKLRFEIFMISCSYLIGFLLLQLGLRMVSVSFAVTMRGFEPVTTCFMSIFILSEAMNKAQWVAVSLVVVGVSLCAGADRSWNGNGLFVLFLCDLSFSSRSLFVKLLRRKCSGLNVEQMNGASIYFVTTMIGAIFLLMYCASKYLGVASLIFESTGEASSQLSLRGVLNQIAENSVRLFVNSLSFTLYNTSSYILLGMVEMHVHAVGNAVRQVVVICYSVYMFSTVLTVSNMVGILCVTSGVTLYSVYTKFKISK
jgi:drug/metabolite transporter (DMT)-like permease